MRLEIMNRKKKKTVKNTNVEAKQYLTKNKWITEEIKVETRKFLK